MKNIIRYTTLLMSVILLFIVTAQSFAEPLKMEFVQTTLSATPTAAPSKATGTPTPSSNPNVSTTSFTQADLSLLTGNLTKSGIS